MSSLQNWNPFSVSLIFKFCYKIEQIVVGFESRNKKNKLEVDLLDFDLSIDFFLF